MDMRFLDLVVLSQQCYVFMTKDKYLAQIMFFGKHAMSNILGNYVVGDKIPAGCLHSKTKVLNTSNDTPNPNGTNLYQTITIVYRIL